VDCELKNIALQFDLEGDITDISASGNGHINDTFCIKTDANKVYILQRVNSNVFKKPADVMSNISAVTVFLQEKIRNQGGDPLRESMTLVPAIDGKPYFAANETDYYRIYVFIDEAISYDEIDSPEIFYNAAKSFGRFQSMLSDFPAEKLKETIPGFHDTYRYYEKFEKAVKEDCKGRCAEVAEEIQFVRDRVNDTKIVMAALERNELPLRVTHNDTKLNNVMFDKVTNDALCVIDLDTVMSGSLLFDFGDAIRFGANTAAEDETDISKIKISLELFEAFTKGYLDELKDCMTEKEIELLPFSAKLLTFECGIRFLTDYLVGDTYFKIHKPKHNLDRARNQFALVADMEKKMTDMEKIVQDIIK
jgi:Ser/Thr protein kinase RdoA (MazF antagonist)